MTFETFPQLWIELLQIIGVDDFVAQVQLCSYRQLCSNEPVDIHNNLGKERPLLLEYGIMIKWRKWVNGKLLCPADCFLFLIMKL